MLSLLTKSLFFFPAALGITYGKSLPEALKILTQEQTAKC